MLSDAIVNNPRTKKIWAAQTGRDKKPQIVGRLLDGVYWQSYSADHLINHARYGITNAKGMDVGVYRQLIGAHTWRIVEEKTHKELYIPIKSIDVLLKAHVAKEADIGYGTQIFIPLDRFTPGDKKPLDLAGVQKELF